MTRKRVFMTRRPLSNRLESDVIARLKRVSTTRKIPVNDVISLALDGLEGEREVAQTITDRIEFIENNLTALVDLIKDLIDKNDRHFIQALEDLKKGLKSLYILLEDKIDRHFSGGKP